MIDKIVLIVTLLAVFETYALEEPVDPFTITGSQVIRFHSQLLDRDYDLYVKLPSSYLENEDSSYPVLILNDADYAFPIATSAYRQLNNSRHIEDIILVGISYSIGDSAGLSRSRDYLPTNSPNEPVGHSRDAKLASGYAKEYLGFLRNELFEYMEINFNADLQRIGISGHSFGGLFAAYALATAPQSFRYYVIADPSLWYDDGILLNMLGESAIDSEIDILLVGANPFPDQPDDQQNMMSNTLTMSNLLESKFGEERVTTLIFDDEIHESIFPIALTRGLRLLYGR